jgi:AraC-like DNA-binding protein
MPEIENISLWEAAPQRLFSDVASSSTTSWDTDRILEVLKFGLQILTPDSLNKLILPPQKGLAPLRTRSRKDLHYHSHVELGIVLRGEMTIWWEGTTIACAAGSLFVIPPGTRYLPHVLDTKKPSPPHSVAWLALHPGCAIVHLCALDGKTHTLSEYYCFTETQVMGQARSLEQELADRAPFFETAIRGSLLCLFTWLLRAPVHSVSRREGEAPDRASADTDSFRERVENYLLSHYHRPMTLSQIARAVGCSPAYLCRHFRKLTGQTPFQYLRGIRMDAAKRLLCSEVPISRVATMVGFDDPLYFSKVFSGETGMSPQSFRKQNQTAP